jgi:hypothetical protein
MPQVMLSVLEQARQAFARSVQPLANDDFSLQMLAENGVGLILADDNEVVSAKQMRTTKPHRCIGSLQLLQRHQRLVLLRSPVLFHQVF